MSIFFISAILGITLHFAFLFYERKPRRFPRRGRVAKRRLWKKTRRVGRDLARFRFNAILFATIAFVSISLFFLFRPQLYLLWDRDVTLSEFLDMPGLGQFGFGLGFGVFAGYWLRTIIFRKRDQPAGYGEIALTALLGILLVIGLVGERSLSRAFGRLTTLEAGGVKIGFSTLSAKDPSLGPAYDSTSQSSRISIAESEGLNLVALLYSTKEKQKSQMQRDLDQIALLTTTRTVGATKSGADDKSAAENKGTDKPDGIADVVRPLVDCALHHAESNGDSNRLGDLLQPLAAAMRTYVLRQENGWGADDPASDSLLDLGHSVEALQRETHWSCGLENYERKLISLAKENQPDVYTYIAIAGLLAYDHRYAAAVTMIERWLKKHRPPSDQNTIQSIRMRGFLLSLLEEWLHGLDFVRPDKAILDYQLNNIEEQIALFEDDNVVDAIDVVASRMKPDDDEDRHYVAGRFMFPPDDHEACVFDKDKENAKTALYLERSLISAKLNWITVALDNPDYASKYAAKAKAYAKELLNLDLSCLANIADDVDGIDVIRANTLEAVARVSLAAYAQPNREIGAEGASMRQELERALQAVILAEYLLDGPEKNEEIAIRAQASSCSLADSTETDAPNTTTAVSNTKTDVSPRCMLHPIVKNFTKQSKADLKMLKRQLKQALESVD